MSILDDFPDFRDVPRTLDNKTDWLFLVIKKLKGEIDGLKAQLAVLGSNGPSASQGAPAAGVGPKPTRMVDYPMFKGKDRIRTLEGHFAALGGEPSETACLDKLVFFSGRAQTNVTFAKHFKVSKEEATAWTYILKKRGWIIWSDDAKGLILTKNSPVPDATT